MNAKPAVLARLAPLAGACLLALAPTWAQAALEVSKVSATAMGNWSADGSERTDVAPNPGLLPTSDALAWEGLGSSDVLLHAYADPSGVFGARSSGNGTYDVASSMRFALTITNTGSQATNGTFVFYITPGVLTVVPRHYGEGEHADASINFDITSSRSGVGFHSAASLRVDEAGVQTSITGTDLYTRSSGGYQIRGGQFSIDLGSLAAGESIDLVYKIATTATGKSTPVQNADFAWQETIPGHWVQYERCDESMKCEQVTEWVDERVVQHASFVDQAGSHASSGDPVALSGQTQNARVLGDGGKAALYAVMATAEVGNQVPEPGSLALVGLALGALTLRRRMH